VRSGTRANQQKQIQFHSTSDPQHEHIVIHGSRNNLAPEIRAALEQERERRKSKLKTAKPAEVAPTVPPQDVHSAISATAKALRKAKPNADEVIAAARPERDDAQLQKTLCLLRNFSSCR
jgi:hypothetical protein